MEALIHFGVDRLPVRVSSICREAGFTLRSYQAAGEFLCRNGLEEQAHSSDSCPRRCGVPLVFYSGAMVPGRIRFTIAHELGHIFLGHLNGGLPTGRSREAKWLIRRSSSRPMCLHPVCLHRPLSYMRSAHRPAADCAGLRHIHAGGHISSGQAWCAGERNRFESSPLGARCASNLIRARQLIT